MQSRWGVWSRASSLWGVAFALTLIAGFATSGGETPEANASAAAVAAYYSAHRTEVETSNIILLFAFLFALLWAASLRSYVRRAALSDGPAALILPGAVLMAVGASTLGSLEYGLAHELGSLSPQTQQTASFLANELFLPLLIGIFVFLLGAGLSILRGGMLPRWLGWVAVVIAVLALVPPTVIGALIALVLWSLVTGVLMFLRFDHAPARTDAGADAQAY